MDGILVIDKPQGLTSHDVVAVARRALRESRIGHTGTLDPLATGVLPLAIGRGTRLVRFLSSSDKDYLATIRFGATTDSYDADGEETSRSDKHPDRAAIDAALLTLRGRYDQLPPAFSAKKVGGRRAYDMARRNEEVTLKPVPVEVTRADLVAFDGWSAQVALTVSAGFYVRSLAHALGEAVGTGAYLEALQRTRSGEFRLEEAMSLDELCGDAETPGAREGSREAVLDWLIPMDRLLTEFPAVRVTEEGRVWIGHGRQLGPEQYERRLPESEAETKVSEALPPAERDRPASTEGTWVRLVDADGRLLALATAGPTPGSLHPAVVLN
jgi:tRNA pseudouridine55 synthase